MREIDYIYAIPCPTGFRSESHVVVLVKDSFVTTVDQFLLIFCFRRSWKKRRRPLLQASSSASRTFLELMMAGKVTLLVIR